METDYKIVYTQDNPDGSVDVLVKYYEGVTSTLDEFDPTTGETVPVNRYRRALKYDEVLYTLV